jgi:hypothetical protein
MLYSLWFVRPNPGKKEMLIAGLLMGASVLFRPQLALLIPASIFSVWWFSERKFQVLKFIAPFSFFLLGVVVTYGLWPARNYIQHNKIILSQNLTGLDIWNEDMSEFRQFIYSVKAEWDPQFTQIIKNQPVTYPAPGLLNPKDSADLVRAMEMSKECGLGFSRWVGYWKAPVKRGEDCSKEIAEIYRKLRLQQSHDNPFNYYFKVPLTNLRKAIFKLKLTDTSTTVRKMASLLFVLRTIMIVAGLTGLILMFRDKANPVIASICLLYFILLYGYLCFGTGDQCRNIEIRYFLPADLLLLIPASYLFGRISMKKAPAILSNRGSE